MHIFDPRQQQEKTSSTDFNERKIRTKNFIFHTQRQCRQRKSKRRRNRQRFGSISILSVAILLLLLLVLSNLLSLFSPVLKCRFLMACGMEMLCDECKRYNNDHGNLLTTRHVPNERQSQFHLTPPNVG